jgi:uncharacterized membrane protein YphA (DoxX/SURF4 family)
MQRGYAMLISVGRVLIALLFFFSGVLKLLDIPSTAEMIRLAVPIPLQVAPYAAQLEQATGMAMPQILAVASGGLEVVGGLLIAFNIAARTFAVFLILFALVTTFFFHNCWDMTGNARIEQMANFMKNLAVIGGLLIIVGLGPPSRPADEPQFDDH